MNTKTIATSPQPTKKKRFQSPNKYSQEPTKSLLSRSSNAVKQSQQEITGSNNVETQSQQKEVTTSPPMRLSEKNNSSSNRVTQSQQEMPDSSSITVQSKQVEITTSPPVRLSKKNKIVVVT